MNNSKIDGRLYRPSIFFMYKAKSFSIEPLHLIIFMKEIGSKFFLSCIPIPYGFASQQGRKYYQSKIDLPVGMYLVWLSPGGSSGFTGLSRNAEICSGLPPPQAALAVASSRENALWLE